MKLLFYSLPDARQIARQALDWGRSLLQRWLAKLRGIRQAAAIRLWNWTLRAAAILIVSVFVFIFYSRLSCARLQRAIRAACRSGLFAARWLIDRLSALAARIAVQTSIALLVAAVAFAFYAVLFGARCLRFLRARLDALRGALRRAGPALVHGLHALKDPSTRYRLQEYLRGCWKSLLAFADRARAALLSPPPPSIKSLGRLPQLLLMVAAFSLVLLSPTQGKMSVPNFVLSADNMAAPESYGAPIPLPPTPTASSIAQGIPTATRTPTPTASPTATATPTAHITAVAQVPGAGYCGLVDGITGTGQFGWPTANHALTGYLYSPAWGHNGVDIAGTTGDTIYAADAGVVVYSGWNDHGYGYAVILDHGNGYQTIYAHFSEVHVQCAARVEKGETLGLMGSTGWSNGPHLHFELRNQGQPEDPLLYLEE